MATRKAGSSDGERAAARYADSCFFITYALHDATFKVRDEHRQDYDPGRGGWGAQAQRLEIERRRQEVEERYADVEQGAPVAIGGGEWKHALAPAESSHKRGRSPDDDDDDDGTRQRTRVDEDTGRM